MPGNGGKGAVALQEAEIKMLSDIAVKVGRLEAMQEANARAINEMANGVNRLVAKLDQSDDIAREADQRAKSAHHRIDEVKDDIKWLWRTVIAAIITGAIGGAIALIWKSIGGA